MPENIDGTKMYGIYLNVGRPYVYVSHFRITVDDMFLQCCLR